MREGCFDFGTYWSQIKRIFQVIKKKRIDIFTFNMISQCFVYLFVYLLSKIGLLDIYSNDNF